MALSPLLQALCDVVRPELGTVPAVIRLEEADPGSACPPVVIKKRGPALVLKLDAPIARIPLLRHDAEGLTSACDYLVFYQPEDERTPTVYVLLCELKTSHSGGARQQIENGKLLAEFLVSMAVHHRLNQAPPRLQYRGIIFRGKGVAEPRGGQMRSVCPYRQHPVWRDLGMATLPAVPERDISFFCAAIVPA
ncbi:hypothetical protein [Polyangium sp. 6x1]|uniref:hypothetical protein n=1 Tax=Polyangium sp. 6x1 TaxID=3042689 RepID=UPI0024831C06|nr:hypothetical protein [Polyangium sp. 6x1]MDI1444114.1 hypothetical protein [Polyangium sp. 6x1]